jgi:hypothetical protein
MYTCYSIDDMSISGYSNYVTIEDFPKTKKIIYILTFFKIYDYTNIIE